jgi:hypothetical protein
MSYDYFLQAYLHKDDQEISTEKILRIFERFITKKEDGCIEVQFDDKNSCTVYMETEKPFIDNITINRPCSGEEFPRCLYEIMQLGNFIFFEPDGNYPIILNPETEEHLPEDMVESLGKPKVADGLESFSQLLANARD